MMTVWLTAGRVYSAPRLAAAAQKLDTPACQFVQLFPDGPVQAGVAGVQPHRTQARRLGPGKFFHHLGQGHLGAVQDAAAGLCQPQQGRVHKAARIDDEIRLCQQLGPPLGDEIGRARPGPHKIDHGSSSPSTKKVAK